MSNYKMEKINQKSLVEVCSSLNKFFNIYALPKDPAFSRFIPMVYDPINFDWQNFFEKDYIQYFNGLMIKGDDFVNEFFLASFPTDEILEKFIAQSEKGDLLFLHHPINME